MSTHNPDGHSMPTCPIEPTTINPERKAYREAHKDGIALIKKRYRENNKKKIAEGMKKYREANRNSLLASKKTYREAHKEEESAYKKQYVQSHKKEIAAYKQAQYWEEKGGRPPESPWCVYMLRCRNGALYTGMTNNLEKRLKAHSKGTGSAFVRSQRPFELVNVIPCKDESKARKLEYKIKQLPRSEKLKIVEGGLDMGKAPVFDVKDLAEKLFCSYDRIFSLFKDDPEDVVAYYHLTIKLYRDDFEPNHAETIGKAVLVKVNPYASDTSLEYIMHGESDALSDAFYHCFVPGNHFPDYVEGICKNGEPEAGSVVLFESLEIKPKYRGIGLGKIIFAGIVEEFSDTAAVIIMKPAPIKSAEEYGISMKEWEKGKKKLYKYWASIEGVYPVGKADPYLFVPTNMVCDGPKDVLSKICKE